MNRWHVISFLAIALISAGTLLGQFPGSDPFVERVYHAASYLEPDRPGVGIAPGSMIVVKGLALGPDTLVMGKFPFQTELGGTSVRVTVHKEKFPKSWDAFMVYAWSWQLAVIVPSEVPAGRATITVTHDGKTSRAEPIWIVDNCFGMFTWNEAGTGPAIIQNFVSETELPVNSLIESARAGQVGIIWGTGLGAVSGDEAATPLPGEIDIPVEVLVGGTTARVLYKGRSGCCAGVDQISFAVPAGVEGCHVPVVVRAGTVLSKFATMSIAPSGGVCSDLPGFNQTVQQKLQLGEDVSIARLEIARVIDHFELQGEAMEAISDNATGYFNRYPAHRLLASQSAHSWWTAGMPSPGFCTMLELDEFGEWTFPTTRDPVFFSGEQLDAGSMKLTGPQGDRQFFKQNDWYHNFLGGTGTEGWVPPGYLVPGLYTVTNGEGGEHVGTFEATLELPNAVEWANRNDLSEVRRQEDLTLRWSSDAAEDQLVLIYAHSIADNQDYVPVGILCTERASAGRFTVQSWLLSELPESGTVYGVPNGFVGLITTPSPDAQTPFSAAGIDNGRSSYTLAELKWMAFR